MPLTTHTIELPANEKGLGISEFSPVYPNPPDFPFNYCHLLDKADSPKAIATPGNRDAKIAIIGAGAAGLLAARELYRCGYKTIHIHEASHRTGGRLHSIPVTNGKGEVTQTHTAFEMGAMRMPMFTEKNPPKDRPLGTNAVLAHFVHAFDYQYRHFASPGGTIDDTGIYLNCGRGPEGDKTDSMLIWKKASKSAKRIDAAGVSHFYSPPPDPHLKDIYDKWWRYQTAFVDWAKKAFDTSVWPSQWASLADYYGQISFGEFVYNDFNPDADPAKGIWWGGLGLNEKEAALFYTIGVGDGSWGAFFPLSCLWVLRTVLFGYDTGHRLVYGLKDPAAGPMHRRRWTDSGGRSVAGPNFIGIESIPDGFFYLPVTSPLADRDGTSLHDAVVDPSTDIAFYSGSSCAGLEKVGRDQVRVVGIQGSTDVYDHVIVTAPSWALQTAAGSRGMFQFPLEDVPMVMRNAIKMGHTITSCKLFVALKPDFWTKGAAEGIPPLIATDTLLQGVYAYRVPPEGGVLLASYTWEDDSTKTIGDAADPEAFSRQVIDRLEDIVKATTGASIKKYIDESMGAQVRWEMVPTERGCAKVYHPRTETHNMAVVSYNQEYSATSHLYFSGESYCLDGGWTEPALRHGLDGVIHLLNNDGATFLDGFNMARDYPRYGTKES